MSFSYRSGNGDVISFVGSSPYFCDPDVFRSYSWGYEMSNGSVATISRAEIEIETSIGITSDTEQQGADLLDRLVKAFEYDVRAGVAGIVEIDGYEARAFVFTGALAVDEMVGLFEISMTANFLVQRSEWVREISFPFIPGDTGSDGTGLNYPHNFPYNFRSSASRTYIDNPSTYPSDVRITIFGPTVNPSIMIGANRYGVDCEVERGGRLVIDGRDRSKIALYDKYGNETNVFGSRLRGSSGSGTYIFEKVSSGYSPVTWDESCRMEIVVYDERSMPPCLI